MGAQEGVEPLLVHRGERTALGLASCFELRQLQCDVSEVLEAYLTPVCSATVVAGAVEHAGGPFAELHAVCKERKRLLAEEERAGYGAAEVESSQAALSGADAEAGSAEGSGDEGEEDLADACEGEEGEPAEADSEEAEREPARALQRQSRKDRRAERVREYRSRQHGGQASARQHGSGKRRRRH